MCGENIKQGNLEEEDKNRGKVSIKQLTNGLMTSPFWKCRILSGISIFHVYRCSLIGLKMISCTPWQSFNQQLNQFKFASQSLISMSIKSFLMPTPLAFSLLFRLFLRVKRKLENFSIYIRAKKSLAAIHYVIDFFPPSLFSRTFCLFFF